MTCGCKKAASSIKGAAVKGSHIAQGYISHGIEAVAGIEVLKYERTDERIAICRGCDDSTWMTRLEHAEWMASHGVEVAVNFNDLTSLPKLPKYPHDKKRKTIFCRLCKCPIPEKARVEDEKCPKDFWDQLKQTTKGT